MATRVLAFRTHVEPELPTSINLALLLGLSYRCGVVKVDRRRSRECRTSHEWQQRTSQDFFRTLLQKGHLQKVDGQEMRAATGSDLYVVLLKIGRSSTTVSEGSNGRISGVS